LAKLPINTTLKTERCRSLTVLQELGEGGQGTVYKVDYDGRPMALKWYHENVFPGRQKQFLENLRNNIAHGTPHECFLWPLDVTEPSNGSIGYIMELRPPEYIVMTRFLLKQKFASFQVCADAMLHIVNAFRIMHNDGFSYQDLNDGNFFINPKTGDLLICDNDNVSYPGFNTGVVGKSRYMAPEVVLGQKLPDKASDRFSLALILFLLLCKSHPLEGAGATPPCLTPSIEKIIYGSNPVFIFDPQNDTNRPIRGVHTNAINMWPCLPVYLQDAFIKAFTKASMTCTNGIYGGPRVIEREWVDILSRFRSSIVPCPCGNQEFVNEEKYVCSVCGKPLPVANSLKLARYTMPAYPGAKILRGQLSNCGDDVAIEPVAEIIAAPNDPKVYGIRNASKETWRCITSTGEQRNLAPDEVCPVKTGIRADTGNGSFEII